MFECFNNSFNTTGSFAAANESDCACSASVNTALLLTMDTVNAVSIFVISLIRVILIRICILIGKPKTTRPSLVKAH